jgi:hypothetical protein
MFLVLVSMCGSIHSEPAKKGPRDKAYRRKDTRVNQIRLSISNYGDMGDDAENEWPRGTDESYIFNMGIWIGTMKEGTPLVSCGYDFYGGNTDMCPGPPEHVKDYEDLGTGTHPEDSLYFSTEMSSEEVWKELTGNSGVISHEDLWCDFSDTWARRHEWERDTEPLGLYMKQTVFGWSTPIYENMLFVMYEIENASKEKMSQLYAAYGCDMDVGEEAGTAANDLLGCDIGRSFGWTYQTVQEGGWSSPPPYYVGVRFFEGPRADDTVFVSCHPDSAGYPGVYSDTVLPGSTLVMTSFNKCMRGDASDELRRWRLISGHHWETGDYDPWRIEDVTPGDKRMLLGCGPFDMEPGEVDSFLVVFMFSNGNTGGLNYLIEEADAAYLAYKANWIIAAPPASPELTAIPGDEKVTLIWENAAEYGPDGYKKIMVELGDTIYREYDFEGYRLWKTATGRADDWEELGQWDLNNDITLLPGDIWYCGDEDTGSASGKESNNKGLIHSYVDTDVMNGIPYRYAVTAYDFNTRGYRSNESDIWIAMESGKKEVIVQPRAEPDDFLSPTAGSGSDSLRCIQGTANTLKNLDVEILGELNVTGHEYELHWGAIAEEDTLPVYIYNVWDAKDNAYVSGVYLESSPIRDSIVAVSKRGDSTVTTNHIVHEGDSVMYIVRTTVWNDFSEDTTRLWVSEIARPFDGLMVSCDIQVPVEHRFVEKRNYTLRELITIEPDAWGGWSDSTISEISTIPTYVLDKSSVSFGKPDSLIVATDVGVQYVGNLSIGGFYSSGTSDDVWPYRDRWAHHGCTDIEILWENHLGSADSLTMLVIDKSTGMEIPYGSAFGDNWCFTDTAGWANYKPAGRFLTTAQPESYRKAFYISGVYYQFNGWSSMDWDKRPETGEKWEILSSATDTFIDTVQVAADTIIDVVKLPYDTLVDTTIVQEAIFVVTTVVVNSVVPANGNVFRFGTQGFEFGDSPSMDLIRVVPNPYLVRAGWDRSQDLRKIEFTHLPSECTIRIYTLDGTMIRKLEHNAKKNPVIGGATSWDLLTRNEQQIGSGIYIYHVSTPKGQTKLGKFAVIR